MRVGAQFAFSHFEDISATVDRGEDVEIERPGRTGLHLAAREATPFPRKTGRRILGALAGQWQVPTDEEWAAMEREIEHSMLHEPLMTTGDV